MDVFLIQGGVIVNVAAVQSLAQAQALYPQFYIVERTPDNCQLNIGDTYA